VTLSQFNELNELQQYNTVWDKGILIDARFTSKYKFVLYQVDTFYVEIKYDGEKNEILGLKSFTAVMPLLEYRSVN